MFQLSDGKKCFLKPKKKKNQASGNVSKRAFSKKLCFEMQRIHPKSANRFLELLQKQKRFWSILPLETQGMTQITLILLTTKYTENWNDKYLKIIGDERVIERSFPVKWQTQKIIGESSWFEINSFRDEWALHFFYGVFRWSLPENDGGGGAMEWVPWKEMREW